MSEHQEHQLELTDGGNLEQNTSESSDEATVTEVNVQASRKRKISFTDSIAAPLKVKNF